MAFKHNQLLLVSALLLGACAQVPKESVELSATVGRDLATVHQAHREIVKLMYSRMRADVDRFVDGVYAPYQINAAMQRQKTLAESPDSEQRRKSLLLAINAAFRPDASSALRPGVLKGMETMIGQVRAKIEAMRSELLKPLLEQEAEILGSVDRAYQQLHYANSIVTGHLASIVKVHETQNEALRAIGVDRDLRADAQGLGKLSQRVGELVDKATTTEGKLDQAEENARALKSAISGVKAGATN